MSKHPKSSFIERSKEHFAIWLIQGEWEENKTEALNWFLTLSLLLMWEYLVENSRNARNSVSDKMFSSYHLICSCRILKLEEMTISTFILFLEYLSLLLDNVIDCLGSRLPAKRESPQTLTSKKVATPLFDRKKWKVAPFFFRWKKVEAPTFCWSKKVSVPFLAAKKSFSPPF